MRTDSGKFLDSLADVIFVLSCFEKIMNINRRDIIGKRLLDLFPSMKSYWIAEYAEVAATGEPGCRLMLLEIEGNGCFSAAAVKF